MKERTTPGRLTRGFNPLRPTLGLEGSRRAVTPNIAVGRRTSFSKQNLRNTMRTTTLRKTVIKDDGNWTTPISKRSISKEKFNTGKIHPFMGTTQSKRKIVTPQRNFNTLVTTPTRRIVTPMIQRQGRLTTNPLENSLKNSINTFETLKKSRMVTPTRRQTHMIDLPERQTQLLDTNPMMPNTLVIDPAPNPAVLRHNQRDSTAYTYGTYKKAFLERISNLDFEAHSNEGYAKYLKELEDQIRLAKMLKVKMNSQPFRGAVDVPFTSRSTKYFKFIFSWKIVIVGFG